MSQQLTSKNINEFIKKGYKGWYYSKIPSFRPGRSILSTYELFSFRELPFIYSLDGNYSAFIERYNLLENEHANDKEDFQITLDNSSALIPPQIVHLVEQCNLIAKYLKSEITTLYVSSGVPVHLKRYQDSELYILPFFKDSIGVMVWYALYDLKKSEGVGSFNHPVVVSGFPEDLPMLDLNDLDLVSMSVHEFIGRILLEGHLAREIKRVNGDHQALSNSLCREYVEHYLRIQKRKSETLFVGNLNLSEFSDVNCSF